MAQVNDLLIMGKTRALNPINGSCTNGTTVTTQTQSTKFMREDGTWSAPSYTAATTDKYHTTGTWSGLTYTATANGGAGALAFTIPTGTTASTVCVGNDSRLSNARTPTSHTHGNIQNGGTLQTNDITIASGDKLVVTDSSDSSKIARTSISFDGSTATKCLTQKGTWETFASSNTDTKVTQTATDSTTSSTDYEILFSGTADNTSRTEGARKSSKLLFSPIDSFFAVKHNDYNAIYCSGNTGYLQLVSQDDTAAIRLKYKNSSGTDVGINSINYNDIVLDGTDNTWDGTNTSLKTAVTGAKGTVTQTATDSTDTIYELLFSGTADNTTRTEGARKSQYATFNPYKHAFTFGDRSSGTTVGSYSFAQGMELEASGVGSHAEGYDTTASGTESHSEGASTTASGDFSHAEGYYTTANHESQHVFGEYNITDPSTAAATVRGNYVEIVGNGTANNARSNARTLDWSGNEWLAGGLTLAGASGDITLSGSGNTWDGTNTSLKTAIKDKVSKSSGTTVDNPILGAIAITDNFFSKVASVDLSKSNNNLSSDYFGLVDFRDKNKKRFGYIQYGVRTSGGTDASLRAVNFPAGGTTEYTNSLTLMTSKAGAYTYSVTNPANFRSAIGAAASSSINTKEHIKDLTEDEALKLLEIRPVSFDYKQGFDIDNKYERNYGVIAEETLDIIPSVVNVPTTEGWEFDAEAGTNQELITVDYAKFVPYLIKLVQMQQQEIDELKNR